MSSPKRVTFHVTALVLVLGIILWQYFTSFDTNAHSVDVADNAFANSRLFDANELLVQGSYTGTIAINEPLALGVLDISLIITEANDSLTGILNDSGSLAFAHAAALTGNITSRTATSATFTLVSAPSTSIVSGRQVTRAFTINGSVHENGDIILGGYEEQITGFTPQTLIAQGMFLATRPRSVVGATLVGSTPTATPTSDPGVPTATPTSDPGTSINRIYLPIVGR